MKKFILRGGGPRHALLILIFNHHMHAWILILFVAVTAIAIATDDAEPQTGVEPPLPTVSLQLHAADHPVLAKWYIALLGKVLLGPDGQARPDIDTHAARAQMEIANRLAGQCLDAQQGLSLDELGDIVMQVDRQTAHMLIGWRRDLANSLVHQRWWSELMRAADDIFDWKADRIFPIDVRPQCVECSEFMRSIGIDLARKWADTASELQKAKEAVSASGLGETAIGRAFTHALEQQGVDVEDMRQSALMFLAPEFEQGLRNGEIMASKLMLQIMGEKLHLDLIERLFAAEAELRTQF